MVAKRILVIGYRLDRHEIALTLETGADMAVVRAGDAPLLRAELLGATGLVHMARGDYEFAHDHLRRSLELREQDWDEGDIRLQPALNNLRLVLSHLRQFDNAIHYAVTENILHEISALNMHLLFSCHNFSTVSLVKPKRRLLTAPIIRSILSAHIYCTCILSAHIKCP